MAITDEMLYWAPQKKLGGGWICFKSSPKMPAAPDPNVTAAAQTASNVETARANAALNRVDQYTPYGSLTYNNAGLKKADDWLNSEFQRAQADREKDPAYQALVAANGADWAARNTEEFKKGIDKNNPYASERDKWSSTVTLSPEQQKLLDSENEISLAMAGLGKDQISKVAAALRDPMNFDGAPKQVTNVQAGPLRNSAGYGSIQNDVNMSGIPGIQTQLDTSKVPELIGGDKLAEDLNTQRDSLYKQRTMYMDPEWSSREKALENKLVQQGVVQGSEAWNQAMDGLNRQRTFDYEQAREASITGGGSEQSRLFGLGLSANQNAFSQALQSGQFSNSAQSQAFQQALAQQQAHNAAQEQGFGQDLSSATLNNTAQGQTFTQGLMNANLQNTGRTQSINETMMLRQNPLNELNALRTGSQVSAPQFGAVPQTNVAGTDVMSPINAAYQAQMAGYNSKVAQNNAITGGLFNLGAAAIGSDRSIKENIVKIGMRPDGIALYAYDYKPEYRDVWGHGRQVGVMADEVEEVMPAAIALHREGYKMVNYRML